MVNSTPKLANGDGFGSSSISSDEPRIKKERSDMINTL